MSPSIAAPTHDRRLEPRNRLLASLPKKDWLSLRPQLGVVALASGSVLFEVDDSLERVYFIDAGVASLVTAGKNRATFGAATVGREGVVGGDTLLLGGHTALGRSRVLVPGSALTLKVSLFRSTLGKSRTLRSACESHTRALIVQLLQAVPCSWLHTVEQRCARWLLMCADRTESGTFELAEQGLAEMLGVSRLRLTTLASKLEDAGLACYRDGAVTVLNRHGLEGAACECYRIIRARNALPPGRTVN